MTASATVLALMLTMLALSAEMDAEFRGVHYECIQRASIMAVVALITMGTAIEGRRTTRRAPSIEGRSPNVRRLPRRLLRFASG